MSPLRANPAARPAHLSLPRIQAVPRADNYEERVLPAERVNDAPPLFAQRQCVACAAENDDEPALETVLLKRKYNGCAAEDHDEPGLHCKPWPELPSASSPDAASPQQAIRSRTERIVREALLHSYGERLGTDVRRDMERAYGVDLSNVRVHTDALANSASNALAAQAYTVGQSIYFASGRYQPQVAGSRELLAHELAHVVQNRNGNALAPSRKRTFNVSAPHDPSEVEADAAARAVLAGRTFRVRGSGAGLVQRKGLWGEALDWGKTNVDEAESAVASGAKKVADFTGQQLMKVLRVVSPGLADIIDEGPVDFAKRKVSEALDAHLPAALGGFSIDQLSRGLGSWLGQAKGFITNLTKGDKQACKAFAASMHNLSDFVGKLIENPIVDAVTGALGKVSDFLTNVLKVIAEPFFDGLKQYVSGTWSTLKAVASTIAGWFNKARTALGDVWSQLVTLLGFDGSSEDTVWGWIKSEAAKVWNALKAAVAPAIEPLKKIASVVALLTPMGQIHAIIKYGPKLVQVVKWIWENGLSPQQIREAPADIRDMLESIGANVNNFEETLKSGLNWLSENLSWLADAMLDAASKVTGLPLLSFAHNLFDDAHSALKTMVADVEQEATQVLASIESSAKSIDRFVQPYKGVMSSIIIAIAAPPTIPVLLAGWAWGKLPHCVKAPILDFVLDIAIKAISKVPALPTFGLLWSLLKPGVLAFLKTLRASPTEVKEAVSNKIAKILSGSDPDFLLGFVKGFAQGVWEGISDPIKAIWTVLEGLDKATQYLLSLAGVTNPSERSPATDEGPSSPPATGASEHAPVLTQSYAAPASTLAAAHAKQSAMQTNRAPDATSAASQFTASAENTAEQVIDSANLPTLKTAAQEAAQNIGPNVATVKGNFWGAVQDYFNGGNMTFDETIRRLSSAWEAARTKIAEGGAWLAGQLTEFFKGDAAESELGDKIGWLTGTWVFQVVLDALSAGTWTEADSILIGIAKFINWPMEALGEAFKLLRSLGRFLLDGIKSLGSAIKETASGAFRTVSRAIGQIGEKLIAFGEQVFARLGGKAAHVEAKELGVLGRETGSLTEREGSQLGRQEALAEGNEATKKIEEQAGGSNVQETEGSSARKEAELGAAEAEAKTIMSADSLAGVPVPGLIAQLMGLKLQFSWIKSFDAQPKGNGHYAIHMIASDHLLGDYDVALQEDIGKRLTSLMDSSQGERYLIDTGSEHRLAEIYAKSKTDPKAAERMLRELEGDVERAGSELPGHHMGEMSSGADVDAVDDAAAALPDRRPSDLFNQTQLERDEAELGRERGNTFNAERAHLYRYNEVTISTGIPGKYVYLDSYVEGLEIVSRKYPRGAVMETERAMDYILELAEKYHPGARIANTKRMKELGIANQLLKGRPILEVPVLLKDVPEDVLAYAERMGVTIRDTEGAVY